MNRRKRNFAQGMLRSATPPHLRPRRGRLLASLLASGATLDRRGHLSLYRSEGEPELATLRLLPSWLGSGGLSRSGPRRWCYRLAHRRGLGELLALAAPAATQPAARKLLADLALELKVPLPPLNPVLAAAAPRSVRRRPLPLVHWPAGWRRWGWGSCRLLLPPWPKGAALEVLWWQWLAGLIDGDGHLAARKGGGVVLTIAGHWAEEPGPLARVLQLVGYGRVIREKRAGALTQGVFYRLGRSSFVQFVLERCGPWFQNPERRKQAEKVAARLGITLAPQRPATPAWALGFFEADGCLSLYWTSNRQWLLQLQASSTVEPLVRSLNSLCGGAVGGPYEREGAKPKWVWRLGADGRELQQLLQR